jgi:glycosyltransferase involved in cell wall biosynthesis
VLFTALERLDRRRYRPIVLLPSAGPIEPRLQRLGIDYEIWGPDHEPRNKMRYVLDVLRIARFFRRKRVDLLHINHAGYWRPAEVIAAKLAGVPIVTHYHRVVTKPNPFLKHSSLIVAVSRYTALHSEPKSVPHVVIHNSVSLERFDAARDIRDELGLSRTDVVVSFIGQIREIKGIDLFIKMANRIPDANVKFLIAGDCRDPAKFAGSYTEDRLRTEIRGDARITYVGYRTDIENIYRVSDIVVMPSRWGEPFGLINIEAGAAFKPMVSTRDGGIPEIIHHGENGFLVDRDDVEGLLHYTTQLVKSEPLRRRIGHKARQIVEEQFTSLPVRTLEQAYERLLQKRKGVRC